MKRLVLFCMVLMFVFVSIVLSQGLSSFGENFEVYANALGDYAWFVIAPIERRVMTAEVFVDSPVKFVPLAEKVEQIAQNHFRLKFTENNLGLGEHFYWETDRPRLVDFKVKIVSEGREETHKVSLRDVANILTIVPHPNLYKIIEPIKEMGWAMLKFKAKITEPDDRHTELLLGILDDKQALLSFLEKGEEISVFVEKYCCRRGAQIQISIEGGDKFGKVWLGFLQQKIFLEQDAPEQWAINLEPPLENPIFLAVCPKQKVPVTWGKLKQ